VLEHCILIPELSANLIAAEDSLEQLEREVVVSEVGAKETWGSLERQWEQLQAAQSGGLLKFVPDDEIECEILVLQDKLLSCAQVNRVHCGELSNLIFVIFYMLFWNVLCNLVDMI
jgi:hypothetical protein